MTKSQQTAQNADQDKTLTFTGEVTEVRKGCKFIVKTETGHEVLADLSGKMRLNKIRVLLADRVDVEVSPYDLTRGRIISRK